MGAESTPLCVHAAAAVVAWRQGRPIRREHFLAHVRRSAQQLPEKPYAVNLCEDRYLFLVTFCAALIRGQINLLPNSRHGNAVEACVRDYQDWYRITDGYIGDNPYSLDPTSIPFVDAVPKIANEQTAALIFTSGSTGQPQPHPQRWGDLFLRACITRDRLEVDSEATILSTVPAQHMYGLETSILLPLLSGASTEASRPFFPEDVRNTLRIHPFPRVLVTTPVHLRACVDSGLHWPPVSFVLSATAPMPSSLAERAEQTFQAPLLEIYGSTETGAMATRRTVAEDHWRLFAGLSLHQRNGQTCVDGPQLSQTIVLPDRLELTPGGRFRLLGRQSDIVNIAGKRASLSDLTLKLQEIDGVHDAALVSDDEHGQPLPRLCGLLVAPNRSSTQILRAMAELVDPVFLPRPLYTVPELGRSENGKLPLGQIWKLIKEIESRRDPGRTE